MIDDGYHCFYNALILAGKALGREMSKSLLNRVLEITSKFNGVPSQFYREIVDKIKETELITVVGTFLGEEAQTTLFTGDRIIYCFETGQIHLTGVGMDHVAFETYQEGSGLPTPLAWVIVFKN